MAYEIESPYVKIEVESAGRKAVLDADLYNVAETDFGARCKRIMEDMDRLRPEIEEARKALDLERMDALNSRAQAAVEGACASIVGDDGVRSFKEGCFPGRKQVLKPMLSLIEVLEAVVKGEGDARRKQEELAAHYLSEANSAQTEPDPAA